MDFSSLIIQLISGIGGGNIAGKFLEKINLGPLGNSIAGLIGGGLGGEFFKAILSGATDSGVGFGSLLTDVGGGGIGGAILMVVVGLIKSRLTNKAS
ncbi:hypothetical protein [Burkholderia ubonensis]|uniref:hypothetical protein n=1 Tax=Burkholderia ubonensis TaxID=101571 RepID=UPI0007C663BB|nr:hypothetical protein [Burkholderia ubonensis]